MQVGLLNILKQLRSLKIFNYSVSGLDDKVAQSIRSFGDEWKFRVNLGTASSRHLAGYDTATGQLGANRFYPPSTSPEVLGNQEVKDEEDIK
ncbi:hypothetical protein [Candidatus Bodocaedibacter vickermanii]|uniref:Uncharacterized protein n=1 Tax=Candidatus Bodocaedibacter vickermanii TaxID=2741701 RepID=A0A7L9RVI1_9PROT|nr:hypothetical protein CPBP_01150 [Candidatus Paracaedibacteraceae bacterium 'Lake Konstanz']